MDVRACPIGELHGARAWEGRHDGDARGAGEKEKGKRRVACFRVHAFRPRGGDLECKGVTTRLRGRMQAARLQGGAKVRQIEHKSDRRAKGEYAIDDFARGHGGGGQLRDGSRQMFKFIKFKG